jgi:hypothetical protein
MCIRDSVGSEMCIRDSHLAVVAGASVNARYGASTDRNHSAGLAHASGFKKPEMSPQYSNMLVRPL